MSIAIELRNRFDNAKILVVGRTKPQDLCTKFSLDFMKIDLSSPNYDWNFCLESNFIIYAAGAGRITPFEEIEEKEINKTISINAINAIHLINSKKKELISADNCQISIVTSIAGKIPSPLFALYAASKALLCSYISNLNIELKKSKKSYNRNSPRLYGRNSHGKKLNLDKLTSISKTILNEIENKKSLIIPQDEKKYLEILERAHKNPLEFGNQSYDYKLAEMKKRL